MIVGAILSAVHLIVTGSREVLDMIGFLFTGGDQYYDIADRRPTRFEEAIAERPTKSQNSALGWTR